MGATETKVTTGIVEKNGQANVDSFDRDLKTMKHKANTQKEKLKSLKNQKVDDSMEHPAWIISRLPQACPVSYLGETIMIPPRCGIGHVFVNNSRMLGKLPKGIQIVPAPEKKKSQMVKTIPKKQ